MATLIALLALYGLGTCFSLLGSINVKLMPRLGIDEARFGSLIAVFMFSAVIASLIVGIVLDSIGFKPVAIAGFVSGALVILTFAYGKTYRSATLACVFLGFASMALNTAGNTMAPIALFGGNNPAAASNLANVFFGIGLFVTPLLTSTLFQRTTFEKAVSVHALLFTLAALLAVATTYPESRTDFNLSQAVNLLTEPAVVVAALALFFYVSLDVSLTNWLAPFGKQVIRASGGEGRDEQAVDGSATRLISVYAVAMMAGRLISSQIPSLTTIGTGVIAGGAALTLLVLAGMTVARNMSQCRILVFLTGFFTAPIFPTTVGVTFTRFTPEVYGTVFGIIFAVGLLGSTIVPKAIGNMARGTSVQKGMRLLLPVCLLLLVLALLL